MAQELTSLRSDIVWAVDPFNNDETLLRAAAWTIKTLVKGTGRTVRPVFIWGLQVSRFPTLKIGQARIIEMQIRGQQAMTDILSSMQIEGLAPLTVRTCAYDGIRSCTQELVALARKQSAGLIVVATQSRRGVSRLVLGSFAETLVLSSEVPVFVIHPTRRRTPEFKSILLPTDFSDSLGPCLAQVLDMATSRKARIFLYHKVGSDRWPTVGNIFAATGEKRTAGHNAQVRMARIRALPWIRLAKKRGVTVELVLERKPEGSLAHSIVAEAIRRHCMVALASRTGGRSTFLMGSTIRKLVRECQSPVWILHPKLSEGSARMPKSRRSLYRLEVQDVAQDLHEVPIELGTV